MVNRLRRLLAWSQLNRVERAALTGGALIWLGVFALATGFVFVARNYALEREASAQATAVASLVPVSEPATVSPTSTATPDPTPTPTARLYSAGWATATPTPTPWAISPTPTPVIVRRTREASGPTRQPTQTASQPPTPTPTPTTAPATDPPDRVIVTSIDLDAPVVPIGLTQVQENGHTYTVWDVADDAVSWHRGSALPGQQGNVVLNGHHNIRGQVFRYLVDVQPGDHVLLYVGEQVYAYEVYQKMILKERGEPPEVKRANASWIGPTAESRLTMVTCWPYTDNSHRLVVLARPVPLDSHGGLEE